jgi:hypothetical protein
MVWYILLRPLRPELDSRPSFSWSNLRKHHQNQHICRPLQALLGGLNLRIVLGRVTLCRATHITLVSALGCLIIQCRPNSKANVLVMLNHLFPLFEYRSQAALGQSVLGWVTAFWVCVHPISKEKLSSCWLPAVVSHREELIQCIALHPHC